MKKKIIKIGKAMKFALMGLSIASVVSCGNNGSDSAAKADTAANDVAATVALEAIVDGNTLTYGEHHYTLNGEINFDSKDHKTPTAYVTFTNVPSDYAEFEAVYTNLLGKSCHGVAAMIPMAIELYARDKAVGENCFKLLCHRATAVDEIVRVLKTKLDASQYGPDNDQYLQRYMAAALLKGADNKNSYTPEEPYTVEMCSNPNGVKESSFANGIVYYLYILANGWDTFQRSVEILKPSDGEYYKVFNCPATYTQCKNIVGEWKGLK